VNFRGQKIGTALAVVDGRFTLEIGKFAPASFILE
jgi:hypothetical protein